MAPWADALCQQHSNLTGTAPLPILRPNGVCDDGDARDSVLISYPIVFDQFFT
jgi:hypothetical protein